MRSVLGQLLVLCLLFGSLEGAADVAIDGYPHGTDSGHQTEFGHALDAHEGDLSDSELDGDHCEHCCHAHSVSISAPTVSVMAEYFAFNHKPGRSPHVRNFANAPPTPPPNA